MARRNEPPARTRVIDKMEQGKIDFDVLADIPSVKMKERLEQNIKYIKEYAAKKGLTAKQTNELIEVEILAMRYGYLDERNADNLRSGSYEAIRDLNANNREMAVLDREYGNRERSLGKVKDEVAAYIEQQQTQENKKGRKNRK